MIVAGLAGRDAVDASTALSSGAAYALWALHSAPPAVYAALATRVFTFAMNGAGVITISA